MGSRILIFGGTGLLGRALAREGRRRNLPVLALSRAEADIRRADVVADFARGFRPEVVINCAALARVDDCEARRDEALEVNGHAVANVAAAGAAAGAALVHVSTDYVFDGEAASPYPEDAPAAPLSVYGESKLLGEREALRYPRALVLRTSWLFGPGGANFARAIVRQLEEGRRPLRVVADQVGCPTYSRFAARAIFDLASLGLTGVLHYRNREPVSWHGFAARIARLWNRSRGVEPVATAELPRPARRPAYSVLAVGRVEEALGREVEDWEWGLVEYLERLRRRED